MTLRSSFSSSIFATSTAVRILSCTALVALAMSGCGGSEANTGAASMVLPDTIGEWVRHPASVTYDRETIFDYINGAGEVYRSYAFSHVRVARYQRPEDEGVTVEIFDMGNPQDAYGVFSYAREEEEEGIGAGFERKGSILCFWQNRFYVCVAAEPSDQDPGTLLEEVARGIAVSLPSSGVRPRLVGALPSEGLIPFSDRFFHLHQTLNYNYYLVRENVLNLSHETNAVLARYAPGSTYLLMIQYGSEGEASAALASFREAVLPGTERVETTENETGKFVSSSQEGPFLVLVLDGESAAEADALRLAALERLSRLLE